MQENEHDCHWVKEYALLAADYRATAEQLRAVEAKIRTMAKNCSHRRGEQCDADNGSKCEMQCGKRGMKIIEGKLVWKMKQL